MRIIKTIKQYMKTGTGQEFIEIIIVEKSVKLCCKYDGLSGCY